MSTVNDAAVVVTLKRTVLPRLTLMSVANPWIALSPDPETSHSLGGLPVRLFSQTIAFDPHACARGAEEVTIAIAVAVRSSAARFNIFFREAAWRAAQSRGRRRRG